jgi:hypothetical protein
VLCTVCFSGDKFKKNKMGWECSPLWGEDSFIQGFVGKNLRERDHQEYLGLDGGIIL